MFIFKSVVGKLWMTIIVLVAVVLMILGLFLFPFIDTSFPKTNDQAGSLKRLAENISTEAALHKEEPSYLMIANGLLKAEDAGMILLDGTMAGSVDVHLPDGVNIQLSSIFTPGDIGAVFQGKSFGPRRVFSNPNHAGNNYLALAVPVRDRQTDRITHALVLFQSEKSLENTQAYVKRLFAYVSAVGFLLTTFFAFFLITRITRPLVQLKKAADLITKGDYGIRVPPVANDEIGELASTFNLMGGQLESTIKALSQEKENLASVLRSMADSVISFDAEGRVLFTNPPGQHLHEDWSRIVWNEPADGEALDRIPEPLLNVFEDVERETREVATKLHVQNGVWSIVMAPLYSHDVVRGAVAVLREVTEEHRLDKLRKDFVANVSHELRTPLSMLQGYSEALLDGIAASPEERQELAQVIHDESLRMGRLVKDLLDLARMETGHMQFQFREMNLTGLLHRVQRKFSALCRDQGIGLEADLGDADWILRHADEDRLEQVFTNLLDNAIRHSPAGAEIIMRARKAELEGAGAVLVEIEDRGEGIPKEELSYIFERFYKVDKARTRGSSGGTGLGLAIVKNIVNAHKGTVRASSTLGEGTTFSIVLPVS